MYHNSNGGSQKSSESSPENSMKKYMKTNIKKVDQYILHNHYRDIDEVIREHLRKIKFFQHERLIHLVVTLSFALFSIIFSLCISLSSIFIYISLISYIILIFYIFHYYYLENAVQYMYNQHDKLIKIANRSD